MVACGTGDDRAGEPTADDGFVDISHAFISSFSHRSSFGLFSTQLRVTANTARAASPPAAAIAIPDNFTDSIMFELETVTRENSL